MTHEPSPTLRVVSDRVPLQIPLSEIVFIEVFNWKCVIHRAGKPSLETNTPLTELQRQLPSEQFVRCGRSFLVNLDHLARIEEDALISDTGDRIAIPTRMRQAIRRQSAEYFLRRTPPGRRK